jgi:hypothetical protein
MENIIPVGIVENKIFLIRKRKVMLDSHLAELYGVTTKALNQAVKRNRDRFPADFMFQLNEEEFTNWKSQIVTSNPATKMGLRKLSYAFTEQGVAMLSSVLKSKRAVQVNIMIMRTFVKLREIKSTHTELAQKIEDLETKYTGHDTHIQLIFNIIKDLLGSPPEEPTEPTRPEPEKPPIGFHIDS